jgi:hypothetical protein
MPFVSQTPVIQFLIEINFALRLFLLVVSNHVKPAHGLEALCPVHGRSESFAEGAGALDSSRPRSGRWRPVKPKGSVLASGRLVSLLKRSSDESFFGMQRSPHYL